MTEVEWLSSAKPAPMLTCLRKHSVNVAIPISYRKLVLFATTYVREKLDETKCPLASPALETAEAFADGLIDENTITPLWRRADIDIAHEQRQRHSFVFVEEQCQLFAWQLICTLVTVSTIGISPLLRSERAMCRAKQLNNYAMKIRCGNITGRQRRLCEHLADRRYSNIIRDIFGNPFRPITLNPSWLTSTVLALATGIYQEKGFERMPILADALQDAGCDNEDILNHCRQPREHVRGCWVVDLLLDKK
jgi:hypothetical protein